MVRCIDCKQSLYDPTPRSEYKCKVTDKAIDNAYRQRVCHNFAWKTYAPYII